MVWNRASSFLRSARHGFKSFPWFAETSLHYGSVVLSSYVMQISKIKTIDMTKLKTHLHLTVWNAFCTMVLMIYGTSFWNALKCKREEHRRAFTRFFAVALWIKSNPIEFKNKNWQKWLQFWNNFTKQCQREPVSVKEVLEKTIRLTGVQGIF